MSPLTVLDPVLGTPVPANSEKLEVVPRFTGGWAAILIVGTAIRAPSASASSNGMCRILLSVLIDLFTPPVPTPRGRASLYQLFSHCQRFPLWSVPVWSAPS